MIYNYIFYKSYKLNVTSGNFDMIPIMAGLIWVIPNIVFNLFTILFLVEASVGSRFQPNRSYRYIFALIVIGIGLLYYKQNNRYKKIIERYDESEKNSNRRVHPLIVVLGVTTISFLILMIAGMYRNGDWIFKK